MDIFIFGNCSASYFALGTTRLKEKGYAPHLGKITYWAMPAEYFSIEENWEFAKDAITLRNTNRIAQIGLSGSRDIFTHGIDENIDAWRFLPPYVRIPFSDFDPLLIYSSPIFPYKRLVDIVVSYKQFHPSRGMIRALAHEEIKYSLRMVEFLSKLDKKVLIPEAPRRFKFTADAQIYRDVSEIWETEIKAALRDAGALLLELDKTKYCSESGFTKEEYRKWPQDTIHANLEYSLLTSSELIAFLACMEGISASRAASAPS